MIPYEMPPQAGIVGVGGTPLCLAFPFPSRAFINKIVVVQTGGTPVNFTVTLYNHEDICQGQSVSESQGPYRGKAPPEVFEVMPPTASDAAGIFRYFSDLKTGGFGLTFFSQDGLNNEQTKRLGNPRKLYMKIEPQGSSPVEFSVGIGAAIYQ
jgi:hypothetical protein